MGLFDSIARLAEGILDWTQVKEEMDECFEDISKGNAFGALFNALQAGGVALNTIGVKNGIVQALQGSVAVEESLELLQAMKEGSRKEVLLQLLQTGNMSADVARNLLERNIVPDSLKPDLERIFARSH
jgi:hypothetical protein